MKGEGLGRIGMGMDMGTSIREGGKKEVGMLSLIAVLLP